MMKILTTLLTLLASLAILVGGVFGMVQESDLSGVVNDFQSAIEGIGTTAPPASQPEPDTDVPDCTSHVDENLDYICDRCGAELERPKDEKQEKVDSLKSLIENYNPEYADLSKSVLSNTINSSVVDAGENTGMLQDIVDEYVNELYSQIEKVNSEGEGLSEEERAELTDSFAQKEVDALESLTEIVTNVAVKEENIDDETIVSSVETLIESDVCLATVGNLTSTNSEAVGKVQEASASMSDSTKDELKDIISEAKNNTEDPQKQAYLEDLANLFNISLD